MPDREKVITALQHCIDKPCHTNCPYFDPKDESQAYCLFRKIMPDALTLLKEQEAPAAADAEPVRHGRWIPINRSNPSWSQFGIAQHKCSECGSEEMIARKRCPECGAKMDKEEGSES